MTCYYAQTWQLKLTKKFTSVYPIDKPEYMTAILSMMTL